MTYLEAAEKVTHAALPRWLELARDDNPDLGQRDAARNTILRLAGQPIYPPAIQQMANLIKTGAAVAASGFSKVTPAEYERRRGICEACPNLDHSENGIIPPPRCRLCGCNMDGKPWAAAAKCPDNPPRW
jgi:hypothetical protein